jgi:diguanylate cyclase (GGDEF)-like protein
MRGWLLASLLWSLWAAPPVQAQGIAAIERLEAAPPAQPEQLPILPDAAFAAAGSRQRLTGATQGRGWWRLRPEPGAGERLLLIYHPYSARITVLAPPDYRPRTQSVYDRELDPGRSRRALVFPLRGDRPVFIGVEEARYPLHVAVRDPAIHAAADLVHVRVLSTMLGVLAGTALVVLLFWLLLRERVYLLYAATILLQLLYLLYAYGEAYAIPGLRELARFGAPGVWFVATLSTLTSTLFLIEVAQLTRSVPLLARILRWVGAWGSLLLLIALVLPWPPDKRWFPPVGNLTLLVANVLALLGLSLAWRRDSRHAGYVLLAWVPLVTLSTARALQLATGAPLRPWLEYGLPLVLALAAVLLALVLADRMLAFRRERDRAQQRAEHDPLTGVLNRIGLEERLEHALWQARRERQELAVLYLDLDHFKQINDVHGHALGDLCLQTLVATVRAELRYDDQFGRLGGEEFLLVLPAANRRHARDVAERIRRQVEHKCGAIGKARVALTVSIGVAEARHEDTPGSLIRRADEAMYAAKRGGRNRVVVFDATVQDQRVPAG